MGGVKGTPKLRGLGVLTPKWGTPKLPKFAPNWRFLPQNWGPEMEPGMGGIQWDPKIEGFGGFGPKKGDSKIAQICPKLAFFTPKRGVSSHSLAGLSVKAMGGPL